jgi:PAS domain S-box-containing protein
MLVTGGLALLLVSLAILALEASRSRRASQARLASSAELLDERCARALATGDAAAARQLLAQLRTRPEIISGLVLAANDSIFAAYVGPPEDAPASPLSTAAASGGQLERGSLLLARPLWVRGERVGTLMLQAGADPQYARWQSRLAKGAVVLFVLMMAASFVSPGLQYGFSRHFLNFMQWIQATVGKEAVMVLEPRPRFVGSGESANRFKPAAAGREPADDAKDATEQRFRQLAESSGAVFWMTDPHLRQMIYVSLGYEQIWGRSCANLYKSAAEWFEAIHADDRERVLEMARTRQNGGEYEEEYRIVRPDGSIRWIHDRAFPVRNEAGKVYRIAGIAEDITESKRLEKEVIEISDREQCRLGQDLHDGICQQLVSIAFATDLLRRDLAAKSTQESVRLARITALLDNAIMQARNLSHALYPVNLVGNGLGVALRELAGSISQGFRVVCEAQCAEAVLIHDHAVATHLYRIAQEAVQNATKHADPTRILICLYQEEETIYLSVTDNGLGLHEKRDFGVGLSIMRYRANMAGGRLDIQRGPLGGTMISVAVRARAGHAAAPPAGRLDPVERSRTFSNAMQLFLAPFSRKRITIAAKPAAQPGPRVLEENPRR